jgi:hypothetical protein
VNIPQEVLAQVSRESERVRKYGHVRPPITAEFGGSRFVAVGSRLLHDPRWKTFHDFLFTYIGTVFEQDWFAKELSVPNGERHPLMQWYAILAECGRKRGLRPGEPVLIENPPAVVSALLSFAYDLYTLEHHSLLSHRLINRLKNKNQFQGARYELYVAAAFVRAGFDIAHEDEADGSVSHVEFVAKHRATSASYSIEAKSRHRPGVLGQSGTPQALNEITADLSGLFVRALRKNAAYDRVVFIDINVPPSARHILESEWFQKLARQLLKLEKVPPSGGPLPPAIVFLTNFPSHFVEEEEPMRGSAVVFTGFNNPDFRGNNQGLVAVKYPQILALHDSVLRHTAVPMYLE